MRKKRIVSLLIAMSMMVSLIGSNVASAEESLNANVVEQPLVEEAITNEETSVGTEEIKGVYSDGDLDIFQLANAKLADFEIPEIISLKDIKTNKNVNRLYLQENDEYTAIFQNKDGSKTMYLFNEPIKYTDKYGVMRDKQTELTSSVESVDKSLSEKYIYVNEENDVNTFFPSVLSQETGMLVKNDKYEIEFSPKTDDNIQASASEVATQLSSYGHKKDYVEYNDVFGENSTIQYSASINGMKEDIILSSYDGINKFSFTVTTNGLKVVDVGDYFILVDPATNEEVGGISEVIVFDSSRISKTIVEQNCVVDYSAVEEEANNKYTITITISKEFLESEAVYPVTIDPSIALASTGSGTSKTIIDTPIYSGKATTNYGSYSIGTAGYQDSTLGIGRILLRFPGLENHSVFSLLRYTEIKSATLYMTEGTGNSTASTLELKVPNITSWAETYPTFANANTASSNTYGSATISSSGTIQFDITEFAKQWSLGLIDIKKGIMIKNKNETSTSYRRSFYMSEYSSSKPRIVIKWEPLTDGMAYMLKTVTDGASDGMCMEAMSTSEICKNSISTLTNSGKYSALSQLWCVKLSPVGYIFYTADGNYGEKYALCATQDSQLRLSNCTSETNPYYCWEIVKITSITYAIKNKYSGYWIGCNDDDLFYLTNIQNNRHIFSFNENNNVLFYDGSYEDQSGEYKLNIIFNETSNYNSYKDAVESWNGLIDNVTVTAYNVNQTPSEGLNITVYNRTIDSNLIEHEFDDQYIYAVFLANGTYSNFYYSADDRNAELKKDFRCGVIFLNNTNKFNNLPLETKQSIVCHEVGHALKLCHVENGNEGQYNIYDACNSIMHSDYNIQSATITPFDRSNLVKKWSNMP